MALYKYFQPAATSLPDPNGPISQVVDPSTVRRCNESVKEITNTAKPSKSRGNYTKMSPEQQAEIAQYAAQHGNNAAVKYFSKKLGIQVKHSSVSTWKSKYLMEMKCKAKNGELPVVKSLPMKKRGRPLLIGEKLDERVKHYICAVRDCGGVISTAITIAAATAIVRSEDRNLLSENGGHITLTKNWAKSLLYRMNFVKRRGSSAAKIMVKNFDEVKEQFLLDIRGVVEMEEIPPDLILNWDQTAISIVPGSSWTMPWS